MTIPLARAVCVKIIHLILPFETHLLRHPILIDKALDICRQSLKSAEHAIILYHQARIVKGAERDRINSNSTAINIIIIAMETETKRLYLSKRVCSYNPHEDYVPKKTVTHRACRRKRVKRVSDV